MHKHQYKVKICPKCKADLTRKGTVNLVASIGNRIVEFISDLDKKGVLRDIDHLIEHGYHSDTTCGQCGQSLAQFEV